MSSLTVPSVAFDSETSSYTAVEGESITINIVILDNITQPLTITVRTEDISAVSTPGTSSDYSAVNQTITFQPGGNTSLPVAIQTLQDGHAELVESFRVVISQPLLGIEENVTVYIMDSNGEKYKKQLRLSVLFHGTFISCLSTCRSAG